MSKKQLAIIFILMALLILHFTGKADDELTKELIIEGTGVKYLDSRPLNQGGTFARGPKTSWERRTERNDAISALGGLCFIIAVYYWWKHIQNIE